MTDPSRDEASLRDLLGQLTDDVGLLLRKEVQLARLELRAEASKGAKAGAAVAAAGVAALLGLVFLSSAAAWTLAEVMPTGLAFLIVAVVYLVIAAVGFAVGRRRLKQVHPRPEATVETLKEDVQWAKTRKS